MTDLFIDQARTLLAAGDLTGAERFALQSLAAGHSAAAWLIIGDVARRARRPKQARSAAREVIQLAPRDPAAPTLLGLLAYDARKWADALAAFEHALTLNPDYVPALVQLGKTWLKLDAPKKALAPLDRALKLDPESAAGWNARGAALMAAEELTQAEHSFRRALRYKPQLAAAHHNLRDCLRARAAEVHGRAGVADWSPYMEQGDELLATHRARRREGLAGIIRPFSVLGFRLDPIEQRDAAESIANEFLASLELPPRETPALPADVRSRRLRVGYLSADFRNNATAHLIHRLFGLHDRERFEVFAYSFGPDDGSRYRRIIERDAEHFVDVMDQDPAATAARIAADGIDLLVDLMGFAGNHRAEILARRPAPIQVFWLGYCATTGAPWVDYFLTDPEVSPPGTEDHFSEKLVRLPHSYQMHSAERFDAASARRGEHGLPEHAMVYCSFNSPGKIDPSVFACWMCILDQVPESVLWLLELEREASERLRAMARDGAIDPARLVFAPLVDKPAHLARLSLADLCLDTWLYGSHTTAGDALWAGLPVLTCPGELFAQRVAASLVKSAGLPEMVVTDNDAYVERAVALGRDRGASTELKSRLAAARDTAPLFDAPRFVADLEAAYQQMIDEHFP